jgi:hypothetical protein
MLICMSDALADGERESASKSASMRCHDLPLRCVLDRIYAYQRNTAIRTLN